MAKGTILDHERIVRTDPKTGRSVLQLTSFPVMSAAPYYGLNAFVRGGQSLCFWSQRAASRDAPSDLWRVNVDGSELTQMTDDHGLTGLAVAWDGSFVWLVRAGRLCRMDPETLREEEVCAVEGVGPEVRIFAALSREGRYYFAQTMPAKGEPALLRCATDGSGTVVLRRGRNVRMHWSATNAGRDLLCLFQKRGAEWHLVSTDYDGENERHLGRNVFAHSTWLHSTERVQGCGLPPVRALLTQGPEERRPRTVCSGPYFWHSASSRDGEWIVADTNWPNEGLYLVHVPSGRFALLCQPGASCGHPQWTHPHPFFTPDGASVVYQSDATGVTQLYIIRIPDHLRRRLATGKA